MAYSSKMWAVYYPPGIGFTGTYDEVYADSFVTL